MGGNEELWQRIKRLREAKGWSAYRLAKELGVSTPTVQQWEKPKADGGTAPRRHRMPELAARLGVSVTELEYGEERSEAFEALDAMIHAPDGAKKTLTPREHTLIEMWRTVLDDVRQDVWRQLEQAYEVAKQYERKFTTPPPETPAPAGTHRSGEPKPVRIAQRKQPKRKAS